MSDRPSRGSRGAKPRCTFLATSQPWLRVWWSPREVDKVDERRGVGKERNEPFAANIDRVCVYTSGDLNVHAYVYPRERVEAATPNKTTSELSPKRQGRSRQHAPIAPVSDLPTSALREPRRRVLDGVC
jgi:hypothetical protein